MTIITPVAKEAPSSPCLNMQKWVKLLIVGKAILIWSSKVRKDIVVYPSSIQSSLGNSSTMVQQGF